MSVATETRRVAFTTDGAADQFAFGISLLQTADLEVYLAGVLLTEGVDYTLSATNNDYSTGGTVNTVGAPWATGQTLVIQRGMDLTQPVDLSPGQIEGAEDREDVYDRLLMQIQQLQTELDRCIKIPVDDTLVASLNALVDATSRAGNTLRFDAAGQPIVGGALSGSDYTVSAFMETVLDDADAGTARTTLGAVGLTGNETIAGDKTFSGDTTFADYISVPSFDGTEYWIGGIADSSFNGALHIQNQTAGTNSGIRLFSKDGDGTDTVVFQAYALGTPASFANREYLSMGTSGSTYYLTSVIAGTGTHNPLYISADGSSTQLYLKTDGTVGIGTASPTEELHIRKDQNANTFFEVENQTAGTAATSGARLQVDSATGLFFLASSSYTLVPIAADRFSVVASSAALGDTDTSGLNLVAAAAAADIQFYTGGVATTNERMRIESDGDVELKRDLAGIAYLRLNNDSATGSFRLSFYDNTTEKGNLRFDNNTDIMNLSHRVSDAAADIQINLSDGTYTHVFTGDGKFGIGTTDVPHGAVGTAKFALEGTDGNVAGPHIQLTTALDNYPLFSMLNWTHDNITMMFDAYYNAGVWASSDAGSNFAIRKVSDDLVFLFDTGVAAGSTVTWNTAMVITDTGTTSGDPEVVIANGVVLRSQETDDDTTASAANVYVDTAGRFFRSTSSARYKKDMAPLHYEDPLQVLSQMQGTWYRDKDNDTPHVGLIAEEVFAAFPEAVVLRDGAPDWIEYPAMTALLVESVKRLEQRVAVLEGAR